MAPLLLLGALQLRRLATPAAVFIGRCYARARAEVGSVDESETLPILLPAR